MKNFTLLLFSFGFLVTLNAQSVKGSLTLNGKTNTELKLETNSAVQLFKDFKTGKYKLGFNFKADGVKPNIYKETIVFFDFTTVIKRDGKVVKKMTRKQPIPYFPGDMGLPAEAFDFAGLLASDPEEEELQMIGTMPDGKYSVALMVNPMGIKGEIQPVEFTFTLRKRPGR
ncbi:MAG: hypothetical protein AAF688_00910 [Bacteroidota bacterium]